MKLLLDTHVVLWWQRDDRRLRLAARRAIARADIVWVSAVSAWEVSIKMALGRVQLAEPFHITLATDNLTELPVTMVHSARLQRLPPHHADPFDRMLVAQALCENATLVSHDRALEAYDIPVIWT